MLNLTITPKEVLSVDFKDNELCEKRETSSGLEFIVPHITTLQGKSYYVIDENLYSRLRKILQDEK